MGKKSREAAAARRAHRIGGTSAVDASVRERLRREGLKRSDEIAGALARGLSANDPTVAVRSAQAFLTEAFGKVGTAAPEDGEPSRMVTSLFCRPARDGGELDRLYAIMRDGRILQVTTLAFDEPEPGVDGPH